MRVRRVGRAGLCCSDLCFAACDSLLKGLAWERGSIDALLFVSHSCRLPYFRRPGCLLQDRLGLSQSCAAFDVALGCSGYITACGLARTDRRRMQTCPGSAGEMASRIASPLDRSTVPLFGDAGTATALESAARSPGVFRVGHRRRRLPALDHPGGDIHRKGPHSAQTLVRTPQADANTRCEEDLFMNGAEVFAFTLRQVPPLLSAVLKRAQWEKEDVDCFFSTGPTISFWSIWRGGWVFPRRKFRSSLEVTETRVPLRSLWP